MKREFSDIVNSLKTTIADYSYYTNFEKVFNNVDKFNVELNILNSLIGSNNIEIDFISIINKYPETLKVIPLLLAIRKLEVEVIDGTKIIYNFKKRNVSDKEYVKFMRNTGLFNLLENSKIKNLYDYITGVEVGLDSNARKNRTGTTMEKIVESFISKVSGIEYHCEMTKTQIKEKYNINLDDLIIGNLNSETSLDDADKLVLDNLVVEKVKKRNDAEKRFDFVVKTEKSIYLIETNFYGGGGSKLNETSRSFKSLANDIKNIDNVNFVWITDGIGWKDAIRNLKETYEVMDHFYTIEDLENNVLKELFK